MRGAAGELLHCAGRRPESERAGRTIRKGAGRGMDHAEIRTDELTAQGAVLVVRVPADCREELSGIRSYVADSLAMGVLVLEERMSWLL